MIEFPARKLINKSSSLVPATCQKIFINIGDILVKVRGSGMKV